MDVVLLLLTLGKLLGCLFLGIVVYVAVRMLRPACIAYLPEDAAQSRLFRLTPRLYGLVCFMCFLAVFL